MQNGFLMSDLPISYLARILCVETKTVNRWCQQGFVETAYQTPGGHWRIENYKKARKSLRKAELPKRTTTSKIKGVSELSNKIKNSNKTVLPAIKARFLELHLAISDDDAEGNLRKNDPKLEAELSKSLRDFITDSARKLAEEEKENVELATVLLEMKRAEEKPTAKNIANSLGISRRSLYYKYPDFKELVLALWE